MTAIEFNNISKQYRLGLVSSGTIRADLQRWWTMNIRGKEDPFLKVGETNDRASKGNSEFVWALKDIDFKVEQGDVVGIIGKNGAGKSTLLKILSKVTGPTTGTIKAKGRIGSLLEVGTGFHPEMTGRENIYLNGAILGMNKQEISRKLDEIVDFSGCERYIDTPVKRYSSGMMVRLGFAVAAHLDPEILVVDEVLAVGDAEFQKKAIGKMQDVSRGEGRTVLFVSHNMDSILNLCHSGVWLDKGMVKYSSSAADTVSKYLAKNLKGSRYQNENPKGGLYISEASFVGDERNQNGQFMFDESIPLLVKIQRKNGYVMNPSTMFGVTLYNRGKRVCTMEHPLAIAKDADQIEMLCTFPASLFAPSDFYFEIAIHIPNVEYVHRVEETCLFTIRDNGTEYLKYAGADSGTILIPSNIQMNLY